MYGSIAVGFCGIKLLASIRKTRCNIRTIIDGRPCSVFSTSVAMTTKWHYRPVRSERIVHVPRKRNGAAALTIISRFAFQEAVPNIMDNYLDSNTGLGITVLICILKHWSVLPS